MITDQYAAGLFDGEGYVGLLHARPRIVVKGCFAPEVFAALIARWGGRVAPRPAGASGPRSRPQGRWEVTRERAEAFLRAVRPHLIEKREQVEVVLDVAAGRRGAVEAGVRLRRLKRKVHRYVEAPHGG